MAHIEEQQRIHEEMTAIANQKEVTKEDEVLFDELMVRHKRLSSEYPPQEPVRPHPGGFGPGFGARTRSDSWRTNQGGEIRAYRPDENICDDLPDDVSQGFRGLTFGAAVRAMITGPRNDLERRAILIAVGKVLLMVVAPLESGATKGGEWIRELAAPGRTVSLPFSNAFLCGGL